MQFLVVWSSNLAHDAPWYARRLEGFWAWSLGAMWALHARRALLLLGVPRFRRIDAAVFAFALLLLISAHRAGLVARAARQRVAPGLGRCGCMAGLGAVAAGVGCWSHVCRPCGGARMPDRADPVAVALRRP